MSKLGISLWVVLLALATNAVLQPDNLEIAQREVQKVIDKTRSEVRTKSTDVYRDWRTKQSMLFKSAEKINKIFVIYMQPMLRLLDTVTPRRKAIEKGFNMSPMLACRQLESHLEDRAKNMTSRMETCILTVKNSASLQIKKIIKTMSDIAFANLTKIMEEVQHCGDNDHGQESNALAISCITAATIKIPSVTVTLDSEFYTLNIEFDKVLGTLGPNSTVCETPETMEDFRREQSTMEGKSTNARFHQALLAV